MWIVPESAIAELITPEASFDAVESVFGAMASGDAYNFPVVREAIGHEDALYGFKGGFDQSGLVLGLKAGGYWPNNLEVRGIINHQSTVFLFDPDTGKAKAMVGGNLLTALRTAAASSVSIKHLAREDASAVAIIGGGVQARLQLEALCLVRPIETATVWARNPDQARTVAQQLSEELGITAKASDNAQEAVEASDIVVTTTPSTEPLVMADWLKPGQLVIAMGSDNTHKNELEPAALGKADLFVCDRQSQCEKLGELHHAIQSGVFGKEVVHPEIGQIISGDRSGRTSSDQLIVCDLTGTGVQDTAIATVAFARCSAAGAGQEFES